MTATTVTARNHGLSCYTANLAGYLAAEWDAEAILARSVRLAMRTDPPGRQAFSHHETPLDVLPDGTRLHYAGVPSPAEALAGLATELHGYGRVLVVADNARLHWSPAYRRDGAAAPHWLLLDRRDGDDWHVVDGFAGLLPVGNQDRYTGWLSTPQLCDAMTLPRWTGVQQRRNSLAFGFPVPVPAVAPGGAQWLRRTPATARSATLPGHWLTGDAQVLGHLAGHFAEHGEQAAEYLDDCWAAAGHRAFAYRWRLAQPGLDSGARHRLEIALALWEGLPRALRYTVEAARHGRPRPALARQAIEDLLRADPEREVAP